MTNGEVLLVLGVILVIVLWVHAVRADLRARAARREERALRENNRRARIHEREQERAAKRAAKAAQLQVKHEASRAGPTPVHGRWRIRYRTFEAENAQPVVTDRVVRILKVKPVLHHLECWCELRHDRRTFSLWGIEQATDAETGEVIDLNVWMDAYKRSRRRPRG